MDDKVIQSFLHKTEDIGEVLTSSKARLFYKNTCVAQWWLNGIIVNISDYPGYTEYKEKLLEAIPETYDYVPIDGIPENMRELIKYAQYNCNWVCKGKREDTPCGCDTNKCD